MTEATDSSTSTGPDDAAAPASPVDAAADETGLSDVDAAELVAEGFGAEDPHPASPMTAAMTTTDDRNTEHFVRMGGDDTTQPLR